MSNFPGAGVTNDGYGSALAMTWDTKYSSYCFAIGAPNAYNSEGQMAGEVQVGAASTISGFPAVHARPRRINGGSSTTPSGPDAETNADLFTNATAANGASLNAGAKYGSAVELAAWGSDKTILFGGAPGAKTVAITLLNGCGSTSADVPSQSLLAVDIFMAGAITPPAGALANEFGSRLQFYKTGDTAGLLFVSAPGNDTDYNDDGGAVFVYQIAPAADAATSSNRIASTYLTTIRTKDAFPGDQFGAHGMFYDGVYLYVGAPYSSPNTRPMPDVSAAGNNAPFHADGGVYIFAVPVGAPATWSEAASIHVTRGPGTYYNRIGYRISKMGTKLFIGALSRSSPTNIMSPSLLVVDVSSPVAPVLVGWILKPDSKAYDGGELHLPNYALDTTNGRIIFPRFDSTTLELDIEDDPSLPASSYYNNAYNVLSTTPTSDEAAAWATRVSTYPDSEKGVVAVGRADFIDANEIVTGTGYAACSAEPAYFSTPVTAATGGS